MRAVGIAVTVKVMAARVYKERGGVLTIHSVTSRLAGLRTGGTAACNLAELWSSVTPGESSMTLQDRFP